MIFRQQFCDFFSDIVKTGQLRLTAHGLYFHCSFVNLYAVYSINDTVRVCRHFIRDLRRTRARTSTFKNREKRKI